MHVYSCRTLVAEAICLVTDPQDFLDNPKRCLLNTPLIRQVLTSPSPDKSLVFIGTQHLNIDGVLPLVSALNQTSPVSLSWPVLNETEPIYTTHYALMDIPHNVGQYWGASEAADLWLPQANQFIPQDFDISPAPQDVKDTPQMVELNDSMCQPYSHSFLHLLTHPLTYTSHKHQLTRLDTQLFSVLLHVLVHVHVHVQVHAHMCVFLYK